MNSNKSFWVGLIVVAIIAITALFTPAGKQATQTFGNVINGNFTTFNGLYLQSRTNQLKLGSDDDGNGQNILSVQRLAITSGTTTPCSMLSPASTSTLINISIEPTVGTTTVASLSVATGTTPFVTTAVAYGGLINYVPLNSFTAVPTTTNAANIPPLTYVNPVLTAATASGGFVMTGFCTATFLTQ